MSNKRLCRIGAAVCCAALLMSVFPVPSRAEQTEATEETQPQEKKEVYSIATVEDFLKFEEFCRIDSWSNGRTVELKADISLGEQTDFSGIATFAGVFRGNGHTVSGVTVHGDNGATGLFRYLEPGAVLEGLTVDGEITSDNGEDTLGGIVGVNFGTIQNCTFVGKVNASGTAGGITGLNGASGTISRCTASGTVVSKSTVGGVAGRNYGVITDCVHSGSVNADSSWVDDDSSSGSILTQGKELVFGGGDIGGIAGWSGGTLAGCKNTGIVGYPKVGHNVGGIAGRHCGTIVNCQNSGTVYGKKDVGGIVGQFEPSITLEDTEELNTEVNRLHELIDAAVNDLQSLTGTMHRDMSDLQAHSETARQSADKMLKEARDVADANMDVINDLTSRVDYVKNHLPTVMDYLDAAFDGMDAVGDDIDQVRDDLDILGKMEDSEFDPNRNDRLTLTAGVGGSISADNRSPEAGAQVTVTTSAQTGYVLKSLKLSGASVEDVTGQVSGGSYTFTMPEENIQVLAAFDYVGEYLPESNPGGRVQAAVEGDNLKIRAVADSGYSLESITVDGTSVDLSTGDGDVYTVAKPASSDARIYVTFRALENGHSVLTPRTTGGRVQADTSKAQSGTTVTVTVTTDSGYRLDALTAGGTDILANASGERTYTFTMPNNDVTVEGRFVYEGDGDIACVSNAGGTVAATANPATSDYVITVTPDSGYSIVSLTLTDGTGASKTIPAADLEETLGVKNYTLSMNNYTAPVEAKGEFVKNQGSVTVRTVESAGGTVTANRVQASAGDEITFAVASQAHYGVESLTINGEDKLADLDGGVVHYTVPDGAAGEIVAVAQFRPARVAVVSVDDPVSGGTAEGGSAAYVVSGTQVELTVSPTTGYTAELLSVSGGITPEKPYADSYIYRFPAQDARVEITFHKQNDKDTVTDAADRIERNLDVISDRMEDMKDTYDEITDLTTDEFGNPRDLQDLSDEELKQLRNLMKDLTSEITDVTVAAGQISSDTAAIVRLAAPYLEDAAQSLSDDLDKLSDDMDVVTSNLQNAEKEAKAITDYLSSLDNVEFTGFSDEFHKNADNVSAEMETISQIMARLNNNLNGNSNRVTADLRKINDQLNVVLNLLIARMDNLESVAEGEDLVEDASTLPLEDTERDSPASTVSGCENTGTVEGTSNVGGIAGCVGLEVDESGKNPGVSFGSKYMVRAELSDSKNNGFVTARTENGGGIVGLTESGWIHDCLGSGSVTSDTGNYLGGIAGRSKGTISSCYSLAELSGGSFIGGIAGQAGTISGCLSMPVIHDTTGRIGAISGADDQGDSDDPTEARLNLTQRMQNNYFVGESLGGVDGVSYDGAAVPVTYTQLLAMENVPAAFRHLTVTFVDSTGTVIYTQELRYGESLDNLNYPNVTAETGSYSDWEGYRTDTMVGNLILRSAQVLTTRILSGSDGTNKSTVLAEGNFTTNARLEVSDIQLDAPNVSGKAEFAFLKVRVANGDLTAESVSRIRLLQSNPGTATVFLRQDDGWMEIPSEQIGQYLQVAMTGDEAVFCVATVTKEANPVWYYYAIGGGCAAAIALVVVLLVKKRKKANKSKAKV